MDLGRLCRAASSAARRSLFCWLDAALLGAAALAAVIAAAIYRHARA